MKFYFLCLPLLLLLSGCSVAGARTSQNSHDAITQESESASELRRSHDVAPLPELPLVANLEVQFELAHFMRKERRFIRESLERLRGLCPMILRILDDEGIPHSLLALAIVESGLKSEAKSYAGAVGYWQFMRATARHYGLRTGKNEDQRRDPVLSTIAAARHLHYLYRSYDNWYLALAAYNAGNGTVSRAMVRAKSDDFWQLARKRTLKKQTARYVPKVLAAALIVKYALPRLDHDISETLDQLESELLLKGWVF